jgi:catechol 2,3-dioxygenase-like lactoylglutathione lyase family enzyme
VLQAGGAAPGDRGQAAGAAGRLSGRLRKVSDSPPGLHMLNLVVTDMAASLDFYRRLGIAVPQGQGAAGAHVQLRMPGGFSLELDTAESARLWHAAWRAGPGGVSVVVGFSLPTREAVDQRYAELTAVGYPGRQPPFDAFWGARYAIVADPDGNDVGLMMPHRRITPHLAARPVPGSLSDRQPARHTGLWRSSGR